MRGVEGVFRGGGGGRGRVVVAAGEETAETAAALGRKKIARQEDQVGLVISMDRISSWAGP